MSDKKTPLLSRREFIGNTVKLAVAGAIIPGGLSQLVPAFAPDALGGGGSGPVIRRDPKTNARIPITLADFAGDPPVVVTAEWNFLPAVVYKVKKAELQSSSRPLPEGRGINTAQYGIQHPDEPDHVLIAYEGKCKHLGCTVGWNGNLGASLDKPDYDEDGKNDGRILCPCHQGQYDIRNLALNVPGTPPPSPLNIIEFDVKGYTDEAGVSTGNTIFGITKYVQNGEHEAHGVGVYPAVDADGNPFTIDSFAARAAGWSEA